MSIIELTNENYKKEVVESAIPTIIDFYSHDCDSCKLLAPIMEKISGDYAGKAKFANCERYGNADIARKYGVQVSAQIVVDYKGQKLGLFSGAMISTGGKHNALKEESLKQRIDQCLEKIVK